MTRPAASLTPASRQALAEAALVLEHAQGFVYLPVLVPSERAGALALEVLRPAFKAAWFPVPWPLPQPHTDDPGETRRRVQADVQAVRLALDEATHRLPAGAVLLLDVSNRTRLAVARPLLVLLNQRREDWRRNRQGLVLLWPQSESEALMQGAPDLWSMRAAAPWVEEQDTAAPGAAPVPLPPMPAASGAGAALRPAQQRQLRALQGARHWRDADMSAADVLALVAALRHSHQASTGLSLAERMLNTPDAVAQTPDWRAAMFMELSLLRHDAGDRSGALPPAQEALAIYRQLAHANPVAYEPDLAMGLNNLANRLSQSGDRVGAVAAAQEAVAIYRRLAQAHPAAYEPDLAMGLNNLASHLSRAGDGAGALDAAQAAVAIYRRLAQAHPALRGPHLAASLDNLSNRLSQRGDQAHALAPAQEAVALYRRLAQANPSLHEPDLAGSLNSLANRLHDSGDRAGALALEQEAVAIRRRLAQAHPAAEEPELALSLNNLAISLNASGDAAGALALAQEAVAIRRRLAQAHPAAHEAELAVSLGTLMVCHAALDDGPAAVAAGRESLALFTALARRWPVPFEPLRATIEQQLHALGHR